MKPTEFDIVLREVERLSPEATIGDSANATAEEFSEIDTIRALAADVLEPEPITYTASRVESAELTVRFDHRVG